MYLGFLTSLVERHVCCFMSLSSRLIIRAAVIAGLFVVLSACRIDITTPAGGAVTTESGEINCPALRTCSVEVSDTNFNETFIAVPAKGYQFIGWKKGFARLCGGSLQPCHIETAWFSDYENMMDFLESDEIMYLQPDFIPSDDIRRYRSGDIVVFSGAVSVSVSGEPTRTSTVRVRQEFFPGKIDYLDKLVLNLRTTTTYLETGEQEVTEQSIWQETNGALFELTDEYGNEYVTGDASDKGVVAIPVPLIAFDDFVVNFYTMYGGNISGPVTEGSRRITVAPMKTITTPMGEYQAYPLTQDELYEYFFTFVDNKSGSTVVIDRNLWVSPAKGLIKKIEVRSDYARSGALQSETRWELDAMRTNF